MKVASETARFRCKHVKLSTTGRVKSHLLLLVCMSVWVVACVEASHRNFISQMQADVGKSIDDPFFARNRYAERFVASKELANGNVEQEYRIGMRGRCRLFHEVDNNSRKIVGWRYEGSKEDCAIP